MPDLTVTLPDRDADRLAELAAREEIAAGLAELEAGSGVSLDDYEREMDAHMSDLRRSHGRI